MERLRIMGGNPLKGEVTLQGAKNSALPILAATILWGGTSLIRRCPRLSDVDAAMAILRHLGCDVERLGDDVRVQSDRVVNWTIPQKLMHEMRSSIVFLGAILPRLGRAVLSFPGGCELGARPIDLHILAMRSLGAQIEEKHGFLFCHAPNGLQGNKIVLPFPSVGATENILLASVLAKGETVIHNAAQEPEIVDLANFLKSRGAHIWEAGKSVITVEGVSALQDTDFPVMPDRIVAVTYLAAAMATGGEITVRRMCPAHIESVLPYFLQMGAQIIRSGDSITLKAPERIRAVETIRTLPYPGFPTDAQALLMATLACAEGTSIFVENIFESRYKQVGELIRMGADIRVEGKVAIVRGVPKLYGTVVEATDLRGGAALCIAALAAQGETLLSQLHHIDRGYESLEQTFADLGGSIVRETYAV